MSNKPKKFKSKSEDLQIGNFIVSKTNTGGIKHINVRSVSGTWRMSWRSDSEFYQFVEDMLKQEGQTYFHNLIILYYTMGNSVLDNEFVEQFSKIWTEFMNRSIARNKEISEEENQRIINEEREKYESKDKI